MSLNTSFGNTLRRLAQLEGEDTERGRLLHLAAAQLETGLDQQASVVQVVLWQVQEKLLEQIGQNNTLISAMADTLRTDRDERSVFWGEVRGALVGVSAEVKKLEQRLDKKRRELDGMHGELNDLRARVERLEQGDGNP